MFATYYDPASDLACAEQLGIEAKIAHDMAIAAARVQFTDDAYRAGYAECLARQSGQLAMRAGHFGRRVLAARDAAMEGR